MDPLYHNIKTLNMALIFKKLTVSRDENGHDKSVYRNDTGHDNGYK